MMGPMVNASTDLCSTGVIIYCRPSHFWLKVSVTECSDSASNYRGELLGAVINLLILRAAAGVCPTPIVWSLALSCDNRGVISHRNSPLMSLPESEKQKQANLRSDLTGQVLTNKVNTTMEWVKGHTVERKGKKNCTLPERLNNQADRLATNALLLAIIVGSIISGDFPFEPAKFNLKSTQVSGSFTTLWKQNEPIAKHIHCLPKRTL